MIKGDEMAFERFSNDYIPTLYRFAQRRLPGEQDLVADLVQTTLCKVISKLDSYRGEAALVTWLCSCLRNEISGHFRKRKSAGQEVDMADDEVPSDASFRPVISHNPEQALLHSEHRDRVHEVLDSLAPHYGRALEWKYLENLSVKEIANRLDLSPKATESILTRARISFREGYSRSTSERPVSPSAA
jgi:RNA polymerase sigma factor (sigma-70 family)